MRDAKIWRCASKDTIAKMLRKYREEFADQHGLAEGGAKIRPHSGRRHAISVLIATGVDEHIGMLFSGIRDRKTYSCYADELGDEHLRQNPALRKAGNCM